MSKVLEPLKQWVCDTCGGVIASVADGYLEWLHGEIDDPLTARGFKIVHHSVFSPRQPDGDCYHYPQNSNGQGMILARFVGPDGLVRLLNWLDPAQGQMKALDPREVAELIRRLHLPSYEDARRYFDTARKEGVLADNEPNAWLWQQNLVGVVTRYGRQDEQWGYPR